MREYLHGSWGVGGRNGEGEIVVDFAALFDLSVGGS